MQTDAAHAAAAESARVMLEAWPWGLPTAVAALLCAMAVQRIAGGLALRPLRRAAPGHWTEAARLAYPAWVTLGSGQIVQPLIWAVVIGAVVDWQGPLVQPLVVLAAFGGAGFVSTRMESRVRERALSMLDWLRSWAVMLLFFLAPLAVFAVLLWQLPAEFNWTVLWMVLGAAAVVLVLTLGGSLAVARWIGLLHAPTDRLNVIVDRAVERVGAPRPTVFVLHWKVANALAFPFGRSVAVTDTALDSLADEELVAICVHELAHLTEPRRIHLLRLAAQFAWLPLFLVGPLSGALGSAGYPLALGSTLIAHLLVRRMVLAMEVRADAAGKSHEGEAGTYARALERLYQINLMPAVTRHRRPTHPHLYDRLLTAGITPDYPRPKPPSRWRSLLAIGFLIVASVFCALMTAALLTSA